MKLYRYACIILVVMTGLGIIGVVSASKATTDNSPGKTLDPVCGVTVDPQISPYKAEYEGNTYYFSSVICRDEFKNDPTRYLLKSDETETETVCGMSVDPKTTSYMAEYDGTTYYFCGAGCRDEFKENPAKFLLKSAKMVTDPVCGMRINPDTTEITSLFNGTTYYFCEVGCKDIFDSNPEKYLKAATTESKGCCSRKEDQSKKGCCKKQ